MHLGYAAGGEESPAINTTEEEQVDKAIIKGALQMDKEKNSKRKKENVYESPLGTPAPSGTLPPPLITWESDDEPSIKVPGLATKTDPMSELKSIMGGMENLYLNLTLSEAEEALNEAEGLEAPANHSQAAALLAELEELQQKAKPKDMGAAPPKLDLTVRLGENDETSVPPNNPNQPLQHETAGTTAEPALEAGKRVVNTTGQEAALTETLVNPNTTNLKTDGGARPKALGKLRTS